MIAVYRKTLEGYPGNSLDGFNIRFFYKYAENRNT